MINSTKNHCRSIQNERTKKHTIVAYSYFILQTKKQKKYRSFEVVDYGYAEYDNKVQSLIRIESVEVKKAIKNRIFVFHFEFMMHMCMFLFFIDYLNKNSAKWQELVLMKRKNHIQILVM